MPTYKTYDSKGKIRWRFRGVVNGHEYSGSAPKGDNTQRAADALEKALIRKLEARVFTGVMPTVSEMIDKFLEYQEGRTKQLTIELQTTHLRKHVEPVLGKKKIDHVTKKDIDDLVTEWTKSAAGTTVNSRLVTLRRMYAVAVDWKYIVEAPKMEDVPTIKKTVRFFTQHEARLLLDAAHPRWRSMMLVALCTGLRIGELRGLQWGDIDFTQALLHVNRTDPGIGGMPANPPKGGRGRTLPLQPDALAALTELLEKRRAKGGRISADEWVWPGVDIWKDQRNRDRCRSEGGCQNAFESALIGSGIKEKPGERLGWHTFRHTFASWLVISGVSLRTIQDLLGHASIQQTELYAHLAPNATHHAAVANIDFSTSLGPPQRALKDPSDLDD